MSIGTLAKLMIKKHCHMAVLFCLTDSTFYPILSLSNNHHIVITFKLGIYILAIHFLDYAE